MKIVAILSSTVINKSGRYEVAVDVPLPNVEGLGHYVGHPDTKALLEQRGAVPVEGFFAGLQPGESYIAVPLQKPVRAPEGTPGAQAVAGISELRVTRVTRIS